MISQSPPNNKVYSFQIPIAFFLQKNIYQNCIVSFKRNERSEIGFIHINLGQMSEEEFPVMYIVLCLFLESSANEASILVHMRYQEKL